VWIYVRARRNACRHLFPGRVLPNASGWEVIGGLAFGHGRPTPTERRSVQSALIFRRRSWSPWRVGNSKHSEIWLDRSQPFRHLRGHGPT
jgi:hypothetical protein